MTAPTTEPPTAPTTAPTTGHTTTEVYDDFTALGGYTLEHYTAKWATPFGLGEMADADTRTFDAGGLHIAAAPFRTGSDESVLDHLKYFAVSTTAFDVPVSGSVRFTSTITATTPGAQDDRVVHGTYRATGAPWTAQVLAGQQGGAVMNMVDFATGQLFDWFVSGSTAFALIERLPSTVTGTATDPGSPHWVGPQAMYTQIIAEFPLMPGPHEVAIEFTRAPTEGGSTGHADWFLDGEPVAHVDRVGIPLDVQGVPFTGTYPSLGPGQEVAAAMDSVVVAHGLFSLLDAFPFSHPSVPELAVSVPLTERLFGQGVLATFADVRVTTTVAS